jgi:hypothetical protein
VLEAEAPSPPGPRPSCQENTRAIGNFECVVVHLWHVLVDLPKDRRPRAYCSRLPARETGRIYHLRGDRGMAVADFNVLGCLYDKAASGDTAAAIWWSKARRAAAGISSRRNSNRFRQPRPAGRQPDRDQLFQLTRLAAPWDCKSRSSTPAPAARSMLHVSQRGLGTRSIGWIDQHGNTDQTQLYGVVANAEDDGDRRGCHLGRQCRSDT